MRIYYIAIGCIVLLGPFSNNKVSADLYSRYGSDRDLYLEENGDFGSGEGPEVDSTYVDHEGSGHRSVTVGPYGAVYDSYDDSEDGIDDTYTDDNYDGNDDEDLPPFEGSGAGGTLYIDGEDNLDDDTDRSGGETVYVPEIEVHETIIVEERPKAEAAPNTTPPPTLTDRNNMDSSIQIHTTKTDDRQVSIFAQPGILAAFIGGAVVGLLCAILLVMFIVYRMRKKDEGSYPLDEPKRMPLTSSYSPNDKEIYA